MKQITWTLALVMLIGCSVLVFKQMEKSAVPPKGYKISVNGVIYNVRQFYIDGEYLKFTDDYNRPIEIHKNFATVSEVR